MNRLIAQAAAWWDGRTLRERRMLTVMGVAIAAVLAQPFVDVVLSGAATEAHLRSNVGAVEVDMAKRVCVWTIGRLTKDSSATPNLDGTVHLGDESVPMAAGVASLGDNEIRKLGPSESSSDEAPVITVDFKVSGANVSGLGIAGLSLSNETYKLFKGAKLSTRSGKFEVRC